MNQKTLPRLTFLVLGLALVLAAWACKPADKKAEATPGTASSPADTNAAPSLQRSSPDQAAQTPAAGSPTFSITPPPLATGSLTPDKMPPIVAKVNGLGIKKDDLLKGAQVVQMNLAQRGQPVPITPQLYHQVLDELIGITLLQQEAKAQGIGPSDQELNQQVAARKKQQFRSEEEFQKALKQVGLTEAILRQQTYDQLAVQKYVETKIAPNATVSEAASKDFYEKNKAQIHSPERLHVRHILVAVNPKGSPADKEKAKAKAEDLLKQIKGGGDFAKLAQANSDDPGSKPTGGDLGWISQGQTPPPFEQAAMALKPNEVSPVVESPFGYHVIQLLERQAAATPSYDQVKDRIGMMLKQKQVQELVQAKIKELRGKGKVEVFL
ncbi:MAG TPA: peptidylprolyl isomerase [Thermoanaerobaculia bacterium]|nr:peptidylprolyl isomerase [Thermoanaerobaculia bacterium]